MGALAGYFRYHSDRPENTPWNETLVALGCFGSKGIETIPFPGGAIAHAYNAYEANAPIVQDSSHRYIAAVSARLDKRQNLLSQLGMQDSISDSELILHAYLRWGEDCLARLIGDFTFVIFDSQRKQFFCARDKVGIRPLYYYHNGDGFYFASSLSVLRKLCGFIPLLDKEILGAVTARILIPPERTIWQQLQRLPPATTLSVFVSGIKLTRYWQLQPQESSSTKNDTDWCVKTQSILTTAVHDRMRDRSGIGLLLSGGLDSSTIAAAATSHPFADKHFFAVASAVLPQGYQGKEKDESDYIDAITRAHNFDVEIQEKVVGLDPLNQTLFSQAFANHGCPVSIYYAMDHNLYKHLTGSGAQVALNGFWGDGTISFSGKGWLGRDLRNGHWKQLVETAKAISCFRDVPINRVLLGELRGAISTLRSSTPGGLRRHIRNHPILAKTLKKALIERDDLYLLSGNLPSETLPHIMPRGFRFVEELYLEGSQVGVEASFPFLDIRVLELCMDLPPQAFIQGGMPRSLIRRSMWNQLPPKVRDRRSKGAFIPGFTEGIRNHAPLMLEELKDLQPATRDNIGQVMDLNITESQLLRLVNGGLSRDSEQSQIRILAQSMTLMRFLAAQDDGVIL